MKILFLSNLLAYGGASKLIYDLLPRMNQKGNDCELLILTDENSKYVDDLRRQGIPVNIVPKSVKGHFARVQYILHWIKEGKYDVIHANLFPTTYYCSLIKRLLGKNCPPMVMTEHSTDNKRRHKSYLRLLEKFIYKKYDHIISISDKTQENLCKWLGTEGDLRFSVVENGIDVDAFMSAKPVSRDSICNNYNQGDVLLLAVGSFTPQKNHLKLLEAIALLPDNYKILLAGEGPMQGAIKRKTLSLGIDERVFFLGFCRNIANIMHAVDILVIPSIWEGFGLVAVEAMACGLPIAASNVPGLAEIVGDVGKKFDPKKPEEIVNSIYSLTGKKNCESVRKKLENRSNKYSIDITVKNYLEIYKFLINKTEKVIKTTVCR